MGPYTIGKFPIKGLRRSQSLVSTPLADVVGRPFGANVLDFLIPPNDLQNAYRFFALGQGGKSMLASTIVSGENSGPSAQAVILTRR